MGQSSIIHSKMYLEPNSFALNLSHGRPVYILRSYIPLTKIVCCWFSGICEFMSISG